MNERKTDLGSFLSGLPSSCKTSRAADASASDFEEPFSRHPSPSCCPHRFLFLSLQLGGRPMASVPSTPFATPLVQSCAALLAKLLVP